MALVGGGLANGLLALHLTQTRPGLSVLLIERGAAPAGNHTWSFHDADLDPATRAWLDPLVAARWRGYDVAFSGRRRTLAGGYASVTAGTLRAALECATGLRILTGRSVTALHPDRVLLDDGAGVAARCVVDGTGWAAPAGVEVGIQRFLGLDLTLERPHGLVRPVIMDATVPQTGGFRFFYLLPWSETRLLVEETFYSDGPALDRDASIAAIRTYVGNRGWAIRSIDREEQGALPVVLGGSFDALAAAWTPGVPAIGVKAGFFHSVTSYSLPHAARLAWAIAALPRLESDAVLALTGERARANWERQGYLRFLNRMLFRAARPEERVRVFARFYGLGEGLIERFYADRLTPLDRARLLAGRPPVPVLAALRCLPWRAPRPA